MELSKPRAELTPSVRTSSSVVPSLSDFSMVSPDEYDEDISADEVDVNLQLCTENSTIPLRQKIEEIKTEKFNPKAKIHESAVLTKTIRTIGVQQLNFDMEKSAFKELCSLDVDKENLIHDEIAHRLARVDRIEIAQPIKCSFGNPKITDFIQNETINHSSKTFRNLHHRVPTLQTTRSYFSHLGPSLLRDAVIDSEVNFFTI